MKLGPPKPAVNRNKKGNITVYKEKIVFCPVVLSNITVFGWTILVSTVTPDARQPAEAASPPASGKSNTGKYSLVKKRLLEYNKR